MGECFEVDGEKDDSVLDGGGVGRGDNLGLVDCKFFLRWLR